MKKSIMKEKRMKKILITSLLSLIIIGIVLINIDSKETIKANDYSQYTWVNGITDRYSLASNVGEMFETSDLVVMGTVLPDKENIVKYTDSSTGVHVSVGGYTLTQFKINDIIQGDEQNDEIIVFEEYYLSGNNLITDSDYQPLRIGNDYILFLAKHPDDHPYAGTYFLSEFTLSKFPLLNSVNSIGAVKESIDTEVDLMNSLDKTIDATINTMNSTDLEFSDKSNIKEYREWYKEVNKELKKIYKDEKKME